MSGGCVEMEFPSEAVIRETVQRVLQEMQNGSSARESSAGTIVAPDTRAVPGSSVQRDHHYRIDPTQGCSSWYNNSTPTSTPPNNNSGVYLRS